MPKILGETNFHTWEFPQSGSKAEEGEKEKKERGPNDGNDYGKLRIATPHRLAHAKPPGPNKHLVMLYNLKCSL